MSTANPPQPEYEFNIHQTDVISGLSYRMAGVGFVFMLIGILQIACGIAYYLSPKNPEQIAATAKKVAEKLGAPVEKVQEVLQENYQPTAILVTALTIAAVGLFHLLIGLWTRQAATGFAGIVHTRGQDVSRLMEALRALRKTYGLVYNLMLLAALLLVISVGQSVYHHWVK